MQTDGFQRDPISTVGSVIALLAIFVWLYVFYKFYKNYKTTGKKQSQYFALALLFGALSITFLALELITFQIFDNGTLKGSLFVGNDVVSGLNAYDLGLMFGIIAAILSSFALFFFDVFSLSFFENKLKWVFLPGLLIFFYMILYLTSNPIVVLSEGGTDYDITRAGDVEAIMIWLFIGPIFMPVVVFLLSAIQVRGNKYNFRRSLFLSFFHIVIAVGYTIEIVGGSGLFSVFARLLIFIFPIGVRLTLNPNNLMKKLLGA